ncbi:type II secretion system F family protein [Arenivirga flava]|uniref:Type II secretion system protein n=1 Tax=Arenivirga flava TaxID=1930060 RepID=A0AA37ULV0_9MICO|nr:type II secretion system F family protein [Arenivirga flava]GMA28827.1 type II secretion system protein [Arenivirga flava]
MGAVLPFIGPALLALALPFLVLAVMPAGRPAWSALARRRTDRPPPPFATRSMVKRLERNLQLAGLTRVWSLRTLVLLKLVGAGGGLLLGVALFAARPGAAMVLVAVALLAVGYCAPDLVVQGRAKERQDRIRLELADTLDQVLISVEAGLGLETAIDRAGRHGRGPLAAELSRTVQDMRLGASRREAYAALAARSEVVDLQRFAKAIMQADAYGVSIGQVVRTQARDLRLKRRQRAEERAAKVPVRVLFPLMFCILPVLFVVVLGPAVSNLMAVFAAQ